MRLLLTFGRLSGRWCVYLINGDSRRWLASFAEMHDADRFIRVYTKEVPGVS